MSELSIEANAVFEDGISRVRINVKNGLIDRVDKVGTEVVDDVYLFPGFIDVHVHAREYPLPLNADKAQKSVWERMIAKESFETVGQAAINGGVVLFAAMPNDPIPPDNEKTYISKQEIAKSSACPVILFACITKDSYPWGDVPYKLYLDHKFSHSSFSYWDDVEITLSRYSKRTVFFHAEDPIILEKNSNLSQRWKNRPPEAEISAVRKILDLTAKHSIKSHICHISTIGAVELIQDFNRTSSSRVTCEVTPHHLFFSVDDSGILGDRAVVQGNRSFFDCNPPLRSEHHRTGVLEALKDGAIDMVAGDHAPHTIQDKINGAPGVPQLDTYGAVAAWLVNKHNFSYMKITELFSSNPASLIRDYIEGSYGSLHVGDSANMTLIDFTGKTLVDGSVMVNRGSLRTKCAWSPFDGIELPGSVCRVIIKGRQVYPFENS